MEAIFDIIPLPSSARGSAMWNIVRPVLISLLFLPWAYEPSVLSLNQQPQPGCLVTSTAQAKAAHEPGVGPLEGAWYMNSDRSIWAMDEGPWYAGVGNKVPWIRPAGMQLKIAGRRLDRTAPALKAAIMGNYSTAFQATGMEFPAEGCWEVTGQAGNKVLRFILKVEPREGARK